eukprot:2222614-Pleurochrysis_carterae.AAC.3
MLSGVTFRYSNSSRLKSELETTLAGSLGTSTLPVTAAEPVSSKRPTCESHSKGGSRESIGPATRHAHGEAFARRTRSFAMLPMRGDSNSLHDWQRRVAARHSLPARRRRLGAWS